MTAILMRLRTMSDFGRFIVFYIVAAVLTITALVCYEVVDTPEIPQPRQFADALTIARRSQQCAAVGAVTEQGGIMANSAQSERSADRWAFRIVPMNGVNDYEPYCLVSDARVSNGAFVWWLSAFEAKDIGEAQPR